MFNFFKKTKKEPQVLKPRKRSVSFTFYGEEAKEILTRYDKSQSGNLADRFEYISFCKELVKKVGAFNGEEILRHIKLDFQLQDRAVLIVEWEESCLSHQIKSGKLSELLTAIRLPGPMSLYGVKSYPVAPDVLDSILNETEKLEMELDYQAKKADEYYAIIRELASIFKIEGWEIGNILEKAKNAESNP